jgi:hypothetical protein
MCRRGSCALCASTTCACTTGAEHPNRPAPGARSTPIRPESSKTTPPPTSQAPAAPKGKSAEPTWELVKADPPAKPTKPARLTVVDHASPFVEQLVADGSMDWHRLGRFPSPASAGQATTRLRKAFPDCEFKKHVAAIYVRRRPGSES